MAAAAALEAYPILQPRLCLEVRGLQPPLWLVAAQLLKVLVKKKKVICPGEPNVVVKIQIIGRKVYMGHGVKAKHYWVMSTNCTRFR